MTYLPNPYKITEIKTFTKDVKLFKIKSNLNPQPGQFLQVSIPGFGECPLASISFDKTNLNLLIRNAGNVTSKIFKLKSNDKIYIRGPYGKGFPINKLKNKNLILVAGGTGIAPITSLISFIEQNRRLFKDIYIFFGFRNRQYILLKEKIKQWKKIFYLTVCLDKKDKDGDIKCETGFVHNVLQEYRFPIKNTTAVMCGPEIMMRSVTEVLNKHGLSNNKIYWSLERRMECGFGNCNRCLIQELYVCKNGPVFRYDIIKPKLDKENSANLNEKNGNLK